MGHMGHMVKKVGQIGDPEISLGWRHSGQRALAEVGNKTAPQRGTDRLGRVAAVTQKDRLPHRAMTRWSRLMMSAFLSFAGSRSTGSLCSSPLPHGGHGAGEQERAVTQAASVEISPDWHPRGGKSGGEGVLLSRGVTWAEQTSPRCNELAPHWGLMRFMH